MNRGNERPLVPGHQPTEEITERVPGGEHPEIHPPPLDTKDEDEEIPVIIEGFKSEATSDGDGPTPPTAAAPPPDNGRRQGPWRIAALVLTALAVITGTFTLGYYIGWHRSSETSYDPFTNYCGDTPASLGEKAMHRRNQIWRAWNGDDVDENSTIIAAALAVKLRPDMDDPLTRLLSDLALKSKWLTRTSGSKSIREAMQSDSKLERAVALIEMMKADAEVGEIIRQILCDFRRIGLFMQGKNVPLETMPSGTAP
jgi:hypothetical protein